MKIIYIYLATLLVATNLLEISVFLFSQEDLEEIVVTSSFLDADASSINNPIHVIQYTDFSKKEFQA